MSTSNYRERFAFREPPKGVPPLGRAPVSDICFGSGCARASTVYPHSVLSRRVCALATTSTAAIVASATSSAASPSWRPLLDDASGRTYFQNSITGETQWAPPDDVIQSTYPLWPWCERFDETAQRAFYWNFENGSSSWSLSALTTRLTVQATAVDMQASASTDTSTASASVSASRLIPVAAFDSLTIIPGADPSLSGAVTTASTAAPLPATPSAAARASRPLPQTPLSVPSLASPAPAPVSSALVSSPATPAAFPAPNTAALASSMASLSKLSHNRTMPIVGMSSVSLPAHRRSQTDAHMPISSEPRAHLRAATDSLAPL